MDQRRQRIHEAAREGLRSRMREEWRLPAERTDDLLTAWEVEAMRRGLQPGDFLYWRDAEGWISDRMAP